MTPDGMDQPEDDSYELAVPFIACASQGGTYDDDAFVAGFQAGQIDQALKTASSVMAVRVWFPMVRTDLHKQLELIAMNRGFPVVEIDPDEGGSGAVRRDVQSQRARHLMGGNEMSEKLYRHKPHEVTAVHWHGDNRAEVEQFLGGIGATDVRFDADLPEPDGWNGVIFTQVTNRVFCENGNWIVVYRPDAHNVDVLGDEEFRRDFELVEAHR